jgi:hypothetical protein
MLNDPPIVTQLEQQAKANASGNHTGIASDGYGHIFVRYYPACGRFAWFGEYGPLNKREAVGFLTSLNSGKWKTLA